MGWTFERQGAGSFVAEAAGELGLPADAIKRDIGQVLLALEGAQEEMLAASAPKPSGPVISAHDEAEAMAWLKAPNLMERIAGDIAALGVVGEAENALCTYLAALSCKLDRPLAVLIQSTSAAGKSALMDAVLDLVPEEERVTYSAMTGQSLFYLGEADLRHKTLDCRGGRRAPCLLCVEAAAKPGRAHHCVDRQRPGNRQAGDAGLQGRGAGGLDADHDRDRP
jgi:hypothetical protein